MSQRITERRLVCRYRSGIRQILGIANPILPPDLKLAYPDRPARATLELVHERYVVYAEEEGAQS